MSKFLIVGLSLMVSGVSFAQETTAPQETVTAAQPTQEKNSRKGFLIGFGLGGGYTRLDAADESENRGSFLFNFKIGGGLSEKVTLFAESFSSFSSKDQIDVKTYSTLLSAQYFINDALFVQPGIGISTTEVSADAFGSTISVESDIGFAANATVGYELRMNKAFALAPQVSFNYNQVNADNGDGGNVFNVGALVGLTWYL